RRGIDWAGWGGGVEGARWGGGPALGRTCRSRCARGEVVAAVEQWEVADGEGVSRRVRRILCNVWAQIDREASPPRRDLGAHGGELARCLGDDTAQLGKVGAVEDCTAERHRDTDHRRIG